MLGSLVLPNLMCPTDPFAGLLDKTAVLAPPRPILNKSLGESYAPNGGPMDMGMGCTIPAWPDGRNCYPDWAEKPSYGSHGLFAPGGGIAYRFDDCQDGLSNTFLIGEQLPGYADMSVYFHSYLTAATTNIPPNYHHGHELSGTMHDDRIGWHADQLRMVDDGLQEQASRRPEHGHGRRQRVFINETIDYRTWVFLGSRSDGENVQVP